MMNLPTELVRRAAANVQSVTSTVTSTVSTVANAASGRRTTRVNSAAQGYSVSLAANANAKCTLTVKCTPNKDAQTTSSLAVKSGHLMKRNEQGTWQNRFLCIVPHMFLYYYDTELGEQPRGIIDLELYNDIMPEDGVLKLCTSEEGHGIRSFYFSHENPEYLNEWTTSLIRDRYRAVCDERDAYQQMQFDLTGAIDQASTKCKMSEREREELERQLGLANQQYLDTRYVLQNTLVMMGITEEEMEKLVDAGKMGQRLKVSIAKMKEGYERKMEELSETLAEQQLQHQQELQTLTQQLSGAQHNQQALQSLSLSHAHQYEQKISELKTLLESENLNFQMSIASKQRVEEKCSVLGEQKKVLVKEVKNLRKKVEDEQRKVEDIVGLNGKLKAMCEEMQKRGEENQREIERLREERDEWKRKAEERGVGREGEIEERVEGVESDGEEREGGMEGKERQSSVERASDFTREQVEEILQFNDKMLSSLSSAHSPHSSLPLPPTSTSSPSHPPEGEEERASWELPQASLRELGWLSEEQSQLTSQRTATTAVSSGAFKRYAEVTVAPGAGTGAGTGTGTGGGTGEEGGGGRRSSMSMLLGNIMRSSNTTEVTGEKKKKRSSMFSLLGSSMGGGASAPPPPHPLGHEDSLPLSPSTSHPTFFSSPFSLTPSVPEGGEGGEESRLPSQFRLRCLRCQGSVEGPRYSTCKCQTPALSPEDLLSSPVGPGAGAGGMKMLSGIFSKGTNVAGALAGGLVSATVHGVGSFLHGAPGAGGHGIGPGGLVGEDGEGGHIQGRVLVQAVPRFGEATDSPAPLPLSAVSKREEGGENGEKVDSQGQGRKGEGGIEKEEQVEAEGGVEAEGADEEGESSNLNNPSPLVLHRKGADSNDEEDTAVI